VITLHPYGGLANRLRTIISAISVATQANQELEIIWEENKDLYCPYHLLFKEISHFVLKKKTKKLRFLKSNNQNTTLRKVLARIINQFVGYDYVIEEKDFSLYWKGDLNIIEKAKRYKKVYIHTCEEFHEENKYYQLLRPIEVLQTRIDRISNSFDQNTIGIHIRRGDNTESVERSPLKLFEDKIKNEIEQNSAVKFYLATDDLTVEQELFERFGESRFIVMEKTLNRNTVSGIQDALVEMFCLSRTAKIYGSYWSSFSAVSASIGGCRLEIVKD